MPKINGWLLACVVLVWCLSARDSPAQTFTTLFDFDTADGYGPYAALVQGRDGLLYGTTLYGGSEQGFGTVFKVTLAGQLSNLHDFTGRPDGELPNAALLQSTDGSFYSTTQAGGTDGFGTVFKITSNGDLTILYSLICTTSCGDGTEPVTPLVLGIDENLYGTTTQAGANGDAGTIFRITPDGILTTIYSFCAKTDCVDGREPYAGLLLATDGYFYGTTLEGGAHNDGVVFKISSSGTLVTLHSFDGTGGAAPTGALIEANDGRFYGTTSQGGAYGHGTIFRLTRTGAFTVVHNFCAQTNCTDGDRPQSGLIQATDGNLYGTTFQGGADGFGTVYALSPDDNFTILHNFDFRTDGGQLYGSLLQATNGTFYGTTFAGGSGNSGTIFSLDMGLRPFVAFVQPWGKVGQAGGILGQAFTGTSSVMLNGIPANFTVVSDTFIKATVPPGATTGYVTVTTPTGVLTSNVPFQVIP